MFLLIFLFWIILSGKITFEIIWIGLLLSVMIFAFAHFFIGWTWNREKNTYLLIPLCFAYLFVLIWEILKANLSVVPYIFGKKKPDGVVIRFNSGLKTHTANAFLANSITLTPGTITLKQSEDSFTVHCLHRKMADGIGDSVFVKLLRKMEKLTVTEAKEKKRESEETK